MFCVKYGLICYNYLENVGNEIQSIATRRFLPKVDYYVDFNNLSSFQGEEEFKLVMNAWYLHDKKSWPPRDENINPLLIAMHLNTNNPKTAEAFLSDESREFLLKYGPVGARDPLTQEFLQSNDIDSYFSGCLTLTLKGDENVQKEDYIVLVDVSDDVVSYVKSKTDKKIYVVSQTLPTDLNKRKLTKKYHFLEDRIYTSSEKFFYGECLLNLYQRASCVITKRLHVALPCLALETPVLVITDDIINGGIRFSGFNNWFDFLTLEEYKSNYNVFDVNNPPENRKDYVKYRKNLISKVKDFTGHESPVFNTFDYNKFSTLFLSKLNNYLNNTNKYVFSLEDKINELEKHIEAQNKLISQMENSNSWKLTKPLRNLKNR